MDKETQKSMVDKLLGAYQILEQDNVRSLIHSDQDLATAKGVISRVVLTISNMNTEEVDEDSHNGT